MRLLCEPTCIGRKKLNVREHTGADEEKLTDNFGGPTSPEGKATYDCNPAQNASNHGEVHYETVGVSRWRGPDRKPCGD